MLVRHLNPLQLRFRSSNAGNVSLHHLKCPPPPLRRRRSASGADCRSGSGGRHDQFRAAPQVLRSRAGVGGETRRWWQRRGSAGEGHRRVLRRAGPPRPPPPRPLTRVLRQLLRRAACLLPLRQRNNQNRQPRIVITSSSSSSFFQIRDLLILCKKLQFVLRNSGGRDTEAGVPGGVGHRQLSLLAAMRLLAVRPKLQLLLKPDLQHLQPPQFVDQRVGAL